MAQCILRHFCSHPAAFYAAVKNRVQGNIKTIPYLYGQIFILKTILLIGSGGFIGSIARYGLQQLVHKLLPLTFPLGILIVNSLGCFAIGLIYGALGRHAWLTEDWKLFLAIGICGGFTTFSSFSYDNIKLLQEGYYGQALLYISSSIFIGLALTLLGISLTHK